MDPQESDTSSKGDSPKEGQQLNQFQQPPLPRQSKLGSIFFAGGGNDQEFVLGECKKLVMQGRYSKAFINLRRHLMTTDVLPHLQFEYYSQVIHICLKLIEKFIRKQHKKMSSKIPPLLEVCYTNIALWENSLINLNSQNSLSSDSETPQSIDSSQEGNNNPLPQKQSSQSNQQEQTDSKARVFSSLDTEGIIGNLNQSQKQQNTKLEQLLGKEFVQLSQSSMNSKNNQNNVLGIQKFDSEDKFLLHLELFLLYILKFLYINYLYHKTLHNTSEALCYIQKASNICRQFLGEQIFISSSQLCKQAAKIEQIKQAILIQIGDFEKGIEASNYAFIFAKRSLETQILKLENIELSLVTVKQEKSCEQITKELIIILIGKSFCEEMKGEWRNSIKSAKLANWFGNNYLFYKSSVPITELSKETLQRVMKKYEVDENAWQEANQVIKEVLEQVIFQDKVEANEKKINSNKIQKYYNEITYQKSECSLLNSLPRIVVRKKPEPIVLSQTRIQEDQEEIETSQNQIEQIIKKQNNFYQIKKNENKINGIKKNYDENDLQIQTEQLRQRQTSIKISSKQSILEKNNQDDMKCRFKEKKMEFIDVDLSIRHLIERKFRGMENYTEVHSKLDQFLKNEQILTRDMKLAQKMTQLRRSCGQYGLAFYLTEDTRIREFEEKFKEYQSYSLSRSVVSHEQKMRKNLFIQDKRQEDFEENKDDQLNNESDLLQKAQMGIRKELYKCQQFSQDLDQLKIKQKLNYLDDQSSQERRSDFNKKNNKTFKLKNVNEQILAKTINSNSHFKSILNLNEATIKKVPKSQCANESFLTNSHFLLSQSISKYFHQEKRVEKQVIFNECNEINKDDSPQKMNFKDKRRSMRWILQTLPS